jgi:hypothetical protein
MKMSERKKLRDNSETDCKFLSREELPPKNFIITVLENSIGYYDIVLSDGNKDDEDYVYLCKNGKTYPFPRTDGIPVRDLDNISNSLFFWDNEEDALDFAIKWYYENGYNNRC